MVGLCEPGPFDAAAFGLGGRGCVDLDTAHAGMPRGHHHRERIEPGADDEQLPASVMQRLVDGLTHPPLAHREPEQLAAPQ